jgi:transcriptional regulator
LYIPKHFEENDPKRLAAFMREHNFAILVNYTKKKPWASHLPFIIETEGENIVLKAHMAKANPQWASFKRGDEVLVIFSEPHSYISPSLYDTPVSVPTWNYAAVHAYGIPKVFETVEERIALMELSFQHFEAAYKQRWDALPRDYRDDLLEGIVAFEIPVSRLEGKFKLSQNRTDPERQRIIEMLEQNDNNPGNGIAGLMKENRSTNTSKMD